MNGCPAMSATFFHFEGEIDESYRKTFQGVSTVRYRHEFEQGFLQGKAEGEKDRRRSHSYIRNYFTMAMQLLGNVPNRVGG